MDNREQAPADARDRLIDFEGYTTDQLLELESTIDPERSPGNYARLMDELNRRRIAEAPSPGSGSRWDIQFSSSTSFRSWIQAKRRRQWFYGRGVLEILPTEIVMSGWQRTWLGMPIQGERRIPSSAIHNVARDNATVVVHVVGWSGPGRKIEFDCNSAESALALCAGLPSERNAMFEQEWQEMRAFHRELYAPTNRPWAATALVLINVLVFLAFIIATKSWSGVPPSARYSPEECGKTFVDRGA